MPGGIGPRDPKVGAFGLVDVVGLDGIEARGFDRELGGIAPRAQPRTQRAAATGLQAVEIELERIMQVGIDGVKGMWGAEEWSASSISSVNTSQGSLRLSWA